MKRLLQTVAILLMALAMTVALCACSGGKSDPGDAEESSDIGTTENGGGEIVVGIAQDLDDSLDPHNMGSAGTREVYFNVYEGLVKPDSDGNLVPAVASEYAITDDGATFTFTLREGVLFHNGTVVTVGDVVYSLERCMGDADGEPIIAAFSQVESVEATDDQTVVVKLYEPSTEFLAYLTAAIIPADYEDYAANPIGTGPFRFVSHTELESIVIERFDDYWGENAYLEKVTFKIISSTDTLVMSLNSGAIDLCAHLTSSQVSALSDDFNILEGTMNLVQAVYLNHNVEPLNNVDVRRAMSYAINRQEIMDIIADGLGTAVGSSMYPAFAKYFVAECADYYEYDVDRAKELLAEAGYPDGFDLTITVPSNYTPHVDTAQIVVEQLKAIGINATIELVEWSSWLSDVYQGRDFEATIVGFDASALTARAMLERWGSESSKNLINYNNSEYDETLAAAIAATDEDEQIALYKRCQEILTEDAANLYIQDLCDMVAIRGDLAGYEFYPLYAMDLSKVYFVD